MKTPSPRLFAALTLLALGGCETVTYRTRLPPNGRRVERNAPFFLGGLVGHPVFDLTEMCPGGPARWYDQKTFLNGFLGWVTFGIYTPLSVVVYCSNGLPPDSAPTVMQPVPPPPTLSPALPESP